MDPSVLKMPTKNTKEECCTQTQAFHDLQNSANSYLSPSITCLKLNNLLIGHNYSKLAKTSRDAEISDFE